VGKGTVLNAVTRASPGAVTVSTHDGGKKRERQKIQNVFSGLIQKTHKTNHVTHKDQLQQHDDHERHLVIRKKHRKRLHIAVSPTALFEDTAANEVEQGTQKKEQGEKTNIPAESPGVLEQYHLHTGCVGINRPFLGNLHPHTVVSRL